MNKKLLIVFGASSFLGSKIIKSLEDRDDLSIFAYFRNKSEYLSEICHQANVEKIISINLMECNDTEFIHSDIQDLQKYDNITLFYCCGVWHHGRCETISADTFKTVNHIGHVFPSLLLIMIVNSLKTFATSVNYIAVTGLSGERGAVKYNGLYNATTTALSNFTRSVGMELSGSGSSCMIFSLGLFDKGQSYINKLCMQLVIKKPLNIINIVSPIQQQIINPNQALNGTILELSDALFNYQDAARILTEEQ